MSIYKDENEKWKSLLLLVIIIGVLLVLSIKFRREIRVLRRQLREIDSWR